MVRKYKRLISEVTDEPIFKMGGEEYFLNIWYPSKKKFKNYGHLLGLHHKQKHLLLFESWGTKRTVMWSTGFEMHHPSGPAITYYEKAEL